MGTPTLFDVAAGKGAPRALKLLSVEKRATDLVWLRYRVQR
jgi:hypothetical protein